MNRITKIISEYINAPGTDFILKWLSRNLKTISFVTIILFILFLTLFANDNTKLTIIATGIASFAGASAAFVFEKQNKDKQRQEKELKELMYAHLALYKINFEMSNDFEKYIDYIKENNFKRLPERRHRVKLNLKDISFIINKDLDLLHDISLRYESYENFLEMKSDYNDYVAAWYSAIERQDKSYLKEECLDRLSIVIKYSNEFTKKLNNTYDALGSFIAKNYTP